MQDIIIGILLANLTLIALLIIIYIIASITVWIDSKLNPIYPHCNIDPLCHPNFIWDKDMNGWIGDCMVHKQDRRK